MISDRVVFDTVTVSGVLIVISDDEFTDFCVEDDAHVVQCSISCEEEEEAPSSLYLEEYSILAVTDCAIDRCIE